MITALANDTIIGLRTRFLLQSGDSVDLIDGMILLRSFGKSDVSVFERYKGLFTNPARMKR
jgi:hypothetical protein